MEKIIEYIKDITKNEFSWLKFLSAVYNKKEDVLTLTIEYNGKVTLTTEQANEIKEKIKKWLEVETKILLAFKKVAVNLNDLKFDVNKFITDHNEHLAFETKNISYDLSGEEITIKIPYDNMLLTEQETTEIESLLDQILEAKYLTKFEIVFIKTITEKTDILKEREEKLIKKINEEQSKFLPKFDVKNINNLYGNLSGLIPVEISTINKPQTSITTAGTIKQFYVKTFKKKKEEEIIEKKYYAFDIDFENSTINCVLFLPDEIIEKFIPPKIDDQVIVFGDAETFNGKINFKVKAIATCEIIQLKTEEKKANKQYEFVKPEPYITVEQLNFFEKNDEIKNEYLLNNSFVVFDLETTGLNYEDNKIIEIGAVKVVNGKIIEQFSTFVNPQTAIPNEATMINNITDDMVKDAPTVEQVLPDFYKFCEGSILVAYNIDFDYGFINYNAKKLNYFFNNKRDDAMIRARAFLKGLKNYKLKTVCEYLDISLVGAHRAVNDTVATAKAFVKMLEKYAN